MSFLSLIRSPRRRIIFAFVPWLLLVFLVTAGTVRAESVATAEDAAAFVRDFGDRGMAMLADQSLTDEERRDQFHSFFSSRFAVDAISRFALGKHWNKANEQERAEYRRVFEDYIVATYARRLANYAGETLKIGPGRLETPQAAAVSSRILRSEGKPIDIVWRLRRRDGSWRIVDIVVEGISLAITQRSEFNAVIRNSGGNIEGLLDRLRKVTRRVKRETTQKVASSD